MQFSGLELILHAGIIVKCVLSVLLLFSVISWAIMFYKWRFFSVVRAENDKFIRFFRLEKSLSGLFKMTKSLEISTHAKVFRSVYSDKYLTDSDDVRRALKRYVDVENSRLENYLSFLATTGSTTPFIGLFGTVWGIMDAFRGIGTAGSAALSVVAPGIAEALITTAVGLLAAIPAVIGYNYFLSRCRQLIMETEDFSEDLYGFFVKKPSGGGSNS
ncbi:MAG: MotA/TolQ/ExbB proton channel family protein [Nitrospirae bacterium]|nr:MotA/TolQ/ExbB proton channel family protein [Nitrospirota bacterium]